MKKIIFLQREKYIFEGFSSAFKNIKNQKDFLEYIESMHGFLKDRMNIMREISKNRTEEYEISDYNLREMKKVLSGTDNNTLSFSYLALHQKHRDLFSEKEWLQIQKYLERFRKILIDIEEGFQYHEIWSKKLSSWGKEILSFHNNLNSFKQKVLRSGKFKKIILKKDNQIISDLKKQRLHVSSVEDIFNLVSEYYDFLDLMFSKVEKTIEKNKDEKIEIENETLIWFAFQVRLGGNELDFDMRKPLRKNKDFFSGDEYMKIKKYVDFVFGTALEWESYLQVYELWYGNIDFWKNELMSKRRDFKKFKEECLQKNN